jgi:hypothetical protein
MATAREIRASVRAEVEAQVKVREDAALSVAAAWTKVEKAQQVLAKAERDAGTAVTKATGSIAAPDLAKLTGIPLADLRRLTRSGKDDSTDHDGDTPGVELADSAPADAQHLDAEPIPAGA